MRPNVTTASWLKGEVPSPLNPPSGCRFRTRCWKATEVCATRAPEAAADPAVADHVSECHHPVGAGRAGLGVSIAGYGIIATAIVLAACMQASIGFGMGMLAAPIVAIVDPGLIPGTLIMLATMVTLMVVVREREDIDLAGTGWALAGRVPGP